MKKIAFDLLEYLRGSTDFMPYDISADPWLYPIDLEFALRDEARHFSPKDAEGLPMTRYKSVGDQYNPTRLASYAFGHWNRLRGRGDERSREPFLRCAAWFRRDAVGGLWKYHFDWGELKAPWISCMAQGEGLSVLTRATLLTGDPGFVEVAREALSSFTTDIADGGVRSRLDDGSTFYEEYPTPQPAHILNGYLFAVIGLIDLHRLEPTPELGAILEEARTCLERNVHRWDEKGWSVYDLHRLPDGSRNLCTAKYHRLHAAQLRCVGAVFDSAVIRALAERWERTGRSLSRRLAAAAGKIRYRLHQPAPR